VVDVGPRPDLWTLVSLVDEAARDAVRRVRRRPAAWWRADSACPGWTRADVVSHLATAFGIYDQAVAIGGAPRPRRDDVLADQLAVTSHDLVTALRDADESAVARHPYFLMRIDTLAAVALAECLVHVHDVDPRPPDEAAAAAVVAALHPRRGAELAGGFGSAGDLLLGIQRGAGEWDWELAVDGPG
jgi:hypothetical protein